LPLTKDEFRVVVVVAVNAEMEASAFPPSPPKPRLVNTDFPAVPPPFEEEDEWRESARRSACRVVMCVSFFFTSEENASNYRYKK